jgi:2-keto-3-deoxy-6-phosphogluconate aldolase
MKWLKKAALADTTTLTVSAYEGGITTIQVTAQTSDKALDLFRKVKEETKK